MIFADKELEHLLKCAEKLATAAEVTYGHQGLKLQNLLIAINEYRLAEAFYKAKNEKEIENFNKTFDNDTKS